MTKLKIKVTKDIYEKAKYCGFDNLYVSSNCAISLAVRDIFPNAMVTYTDIFVDHSHSYNLLIKTPRHVIPLIKEFDYTSPEERPNLPEFEFEVELSDAVVEYINIDELKPLLINHPTLELV